MKRIGLLVSLMGVLAMTPAWAARVTVEEVAVLPLGSEQAWVQVVHDELTILQISQYQGYPAIWLHDATLAPELLTKAWALRPSAFLRPASYEVRLIPTPEGSWLQFRTPRRLTLSVVSSRDAFLEEIAQGLPLYPQWSAGSAQGAALAAKPLMDQAMAAFQEGKVKETTQALETLFLRTSNPPKPMYQLLGALYLYQESWLKALLLYAQGTPSYMDTMGLRYGALLYRMHQPAKAIQVLSDLVATSNLPVETLAQAQYMLGSLYEEQGDYQKALPHLQAASAVYQESPIVLFNLALAYEHTAQPEFALKTYQKALPITKSDLLADIREQVQRLQTSSAKRPQAQTITLDSQEVEEIRLLP